MTNLLRALLRAELTAAVAFEAFGGWWAECAMTRAGKYSAGSPEVARR